MPRSAILLCVRNARKDLHWWIAHHLAVGFDSLLICDDQSDDGTWEFLQIAAHRYDIRITRTDPAISDTLARREAAQRELVHQASQSLNWILPLSLDEYFYPEGASVREFVKQLKERHGEEIFKLTMSFPINWCIFGLNGHDADKLDSRSPSPRSLFTHHAPREFADHRIVRFICRPEALLEHLPDPFSWTDHDVDWSLGRILHDASASSQGAMRDYYNHNEEYFSGSRRFLAESDAIAANLLQTALLALSYQLKNSDLPVPSEQNDPPLFRVYEVVSETSRLVINPGEGQLVWQDKDEIAETIFVPFYLIGDLKDEDLPEEGLFLWGWAPSGDKPASFMTKKNSGGCLETLLDLLPLHLKEEKETACLINRLDQSIFLPGKPAFWLETVEINTSLFPSAPRLLTNLSSLLRYGPSASGLVKAIKENSWVSPALLGAALFALSDTDRAALLPPYLRAFFRTASNP